MIKEVPYRNTGQILVVTTAVSFMSLAAGIVVARFEYSAFLLMIGIGAAPTLLLLELIWHGFLVLLLVSGYVLGADLFAELHFQLGFLPIYPGELVLAVSWVFLGFQYLRGRLHLKRTLLPFKRFKSSFLLFGMVGVISLLRGINVDRLEALRDSAMVYYSLFAFLVPFVLTSRSRFEQALRWLLFVTAGLTFLQGLQLVMVISIPFGGVAVAASLYLGIALIFEILFIAHGPRYRMPLLMLVILQSYLILYMQVRSVWLALAFTFIASYLFTRRIRDLGRKLFRTGVLVVLIGGLLLAGLAVVKPSWVREIAVEAATIVAYNRIDSASSRNVTRRLLQWRDALDEVRNQPVFGIGFGTPIFYERVKEIGWGFTERSRLGKGDPHNSLLTILLRMGLVGFAIWAFIVWRFINVTLEFIRCTQDAQLQSYATGLLLSLFLILGTSATAPLLTVPYVLIPFWLVLGAMLAVVNLDAKSHTQQA